MQDFPVSCKFGVSSKRASSLTSKIERDARCARAPHLESLCAKLVGRKMNILITGGAGFIGRTLKQKLLGLGHTITLLDKKHPPTSLSKDISYIQMDVCNQEEMTLLFQETCFDGIIHLAAVSRVVEAQNNPEECTRTNIGGVRSLLRSLELSPQRPWLIFGSSREVYGEADTLPVSEDFPHRVVNIYGESKVKGEQLFMEFSERHNLTTIVVRFSNVYGNRHDIFDRVIPRFIRAIHFESELTIEGGDQLIDFTHIDDTVMGISAIIDFIKGSPIGTKEEFHLCPGIGWTLQQLIQYIETATGKSAIVKKNPKRNYDVVQFVGETSKMIDILGLKNFIELEDGIGQCISEYCLNLNSGSPVS